MYREHSIAVVVPAYNEADFVGQVIETVPEFVDRIYVIDDASTDDTWDVIRSTAQVVNRGASRVRLDGGYGDRVVPIQHETNRGVGGAIKTGYARARADGMDVATVMAGDGQMQPETLTRFLDPVVGGETDYAKGNRLLNWETVAGMSRFRLFGNVVLTFLTKVASGYWRIGDPQNGYTAIRLDVFDDVDLASLYDEYGFANDLLVSLNVHGKRVTDVRNASSYGDEESTIDYPTFVTSVSTLLLRNFLWRLNNTYLVRDFHPLVLFYYAGAGAIGIGLVSLLAGLVSAIGGTVAAVSGVIVTLFGVYFLLYAMVLDRRQNIHLETQVTE